MKSLLKISMILAILTIAFTSCKKEVFNDKNGNGTSDWVYDFSERGPLQYKGSDKVSGYSDVYDYYFEISMNNAQMNPGSLPIVCARVKKGGGISYTNLINEATYTVDVDRDEGVVRLTIRTSSDNDLKFNLAVDDGTTNKNWFLAMGPYREDGDDDDDVVDNGVNNMYWIAFEDGNIRHGSDL